MRKQTIRISDLARELEVKGKAILDVLPKIDVAKKKTYSSSISVADADKVRRYFRLHEKGRSSAPGRVRSAVIRPKIGLSRSSRTSDVLNATAQAPVSPRSQVGD